MFFHRQYVNREDYFLLFNFFIHHFPYTVLTKTDFLFLFNSCALCVCVKINEISTKLLFKSGYIINVYCHFSYHRQDGMRIRIDVYASDKIKEIHDGSEEIALYLFICNMRFIAKHSRVRHEMKSLKFAGIFHESR